MTLTANMPLFWFSDTAELTRYISESWNEAKKRQRARKLLEKSREETQYSHYSDDWEREADEW